MTSIAVDILLWGFVAALALTAALRSRTMVWNGTRDGVVDFLRLIPRLVVGVVAAGFLAEVLPQDVIVVWFGPDSGIFGLTIATAAGALTPGGPVAGFAIAATGLKSGAGAPQIIAYVSAWSLFAVERTLLWEMPMMDRRAVLLRVAVSLPLPFLRPRSRCWLESRKPLSVRPRESGDPQSYARVFPWLLGPRLRA